MRGFTLTESLVALSIVGVALTALLPAFITQQDSNTMNEMRWGAVAVAQEFAEGLRGQDPAALPTSGTSTAQVVEVGTREYEAVVVYCARPAFCGPDSRHLTVEVRYGGRLVYSVETVFTRLR